MVENTFKKYIIPAIILVLAFLAFLIIKPLFTPIILGLCLAYIFNPVYKRLNKWTKSPNLSALIVIALTSIIIIVPIIVLMVPVSKEILSIYNSVKDADFYNILMRIAPTLMSSPQFSAEVIAASNTIKSSISGYIFNFIQSTLLNLPSIIFGTIVLLFTFFFALRESHHFKNYFSVLFPFPKEYEERFYRQFEKVTNSVLYSQFMIGVFQAIISAIGYYLLGIPNALLLSILTGIVGVLPYVSPWLVWIPTDIFLFINGNNEQAIALLIFGLFVINLIDTLLGPRIVANKTQLNPAIVLIGFIGGVYAFGIIGILLGPLILAYLILLIEIYRDRRSENSIVFKEEEKKPAP